MPEFDLTVAITAHSEGIVAGPTIHSVEAAIASAEADGIRVERLVGLDNATSTSQDYFLQPALSHWPTINLDHGDLGLARNSLARQAQGKIVAFLDADDLFSENWLRKGVHGLLGAQGDREGIIAHPEINVFFDAHQSILANIDQADPIYTPYYWYVANYYDSLAMATRDTFLDVPYRARDKEAGFGYEDWCWNLDTLAAGHRHIIIDDTIIFKRRQDNSLVIDLGRNKAMIWPTESLAIDCLAKVK